MTAHIFVARANLVVTRCDEEGSVLYGRCAHRGALMFVGYVAGDDRVCGLSGWDDRFDTGIGENNKSETLVNSQAWINAGQVCADEDDTRQNPHRSVQLP